jgi:hypothetical protein
MVWKFGCIAVIFASGAAFFCVWRLLGSTCWGMRVCTAGMGEFVVNRRRCCRTLCLLLRGNSKSQRNWLLGVGSCVGCYCKRIVRHTCPDQSLEQKRCWHAGSVDNRRCHPCVLLCGGLRLHLRILVRWALGGATRRCHVMCALHRCAGCCLCGSLRTMYWRVGGPQHFCGVC